MQVFATPWKTVGADAVAEKQREVRYVKDGFAKWWEVKVVDQESRASELFTMIVREGNSITHGLKDALDLTLLPLPSDLEIGFLAGFCAREMYKLEEDFIGLKAR